MRLGKVLNIPIKEINVMQKLRLDQLHPPFMPENLIQWRLLLHIHTLELDKGTEINLDKLKLRYDFIERSYKHKIKILSSDDTKHDVNCNKMFYLLSAKDEHVRNLLHTSNFNF